MSDQTSDFTAAEWLAQAQEAEDSDNTKTALDAVEKALQLDPTLGEAWRLKASLLQDMDQPQKAFQTLNEACQRLPHDAALWFDIGAFLATHNEMVQAVQCYIRCYQLDKEYPRIKTNLGMAFKTVNDFENAAKILAEALEENTLDRDKARVLNHLAEAYIALEQFDKAYDCLDKSLTLVDNDYVALTNMAMVHLQRKEHAAAHNAIDSAIDKQPKNPNLYIVRAAICDAEGSEEGLKKANEAVQKALELAPEDPEIWIKVANRHIHFNAADKAVKCLDKAVEVAPKNYQAWHSRAFLLSQLEGSEDEALASFDHSIELNPHFPGNWLLKARLLHNMGREEEAVRCHRRGLHLTGSLVIWGVFLIDENNQPVEGTQVAIETERQIPQQKVIEEYVARLKKEGHEIDDKGVVDGKYHLAMTEVPFDQVEDKPLYNGGQPDENAAQESKPEGK